MIERRTGKRIVRKTVCGLALLLLLPLGTACAAEWTQVPELVRPGKAVRFSLTGQDETLDISARAQDGSLYSVVSGLQADGDTAFSWDGTVDGENLPAGDYTLLADNGQSAAEASVTVGEEAPQITNIDAPDELEDVAWKVTVTCSLPGTLTMSVEKDGEETAVVTEQVEAGDNTLTWDGCIDGNPLPEGDRDVTFRLTDGTGFSSTPETVNVWIPETVTETLLATDTEYHKPNESSAELCDHDLCYWKLNMGEMNEANIWEVLTQPIVTVTGNERHQVKVRAEPDENCTDYVGEVTCASQGVHVLREQDGWTLVEAYSSSVEGSSVGVFAEPFQGWIKSDLLEEKETNDTYGIVIDKLQQRLYVFKEGKWYSTLLCSTGYARSDTPFNETPAGEFLIVSAVGGFWSGNLYCEMGMRINDGILLHQVPCVITTLDDGSEKKEYERCEAYLGEKASHGCIRIQRYTSPEGVCMNWLWTTLRHEKNVKVIIWDEVGRTLGYPDDELELYYNPNGGKNYHSSPYCRQVKEDYWPLASFRYGELDEEPYSSLSPCPGCTPQLRHSGIDTINEKNDRSYSN